MHRISRCPGSRPRPRFRLRPAVCWPCVGSRRHLARAGSRVHGWDGIPRPPVGALERTAVAHSNRAGRAPGGPVERAHRDDRPCAYERWRDFASDLLCCERWRQPGLWLRRRRVPEVRRARLHPLRTAAGRRYQSASALSRNGRDQLRQSKRSAPEHAQHGSKQTSDNIQPRVGARLPRRDLARERHARQPRSHIPRPPSAELDGRMLEPFRMSSPTLRRLLLMVLEGKALMRAAARNFEELKDALSPTAESASRASSQNAS